MNATDEQIEPKFQAVTKYLTGVYWLAERQYGGMTETTKAGIEAEREKLKRLGYDKPGRSEIHTIKTTKQRIA